MPTRSATEYECNRCRAREYMVVDEIPTGWLHLAERGPDTGATEQVYLCRLCKMAYVDFLRNDPHVGKLSATRKACPDAGSCHHLCGDGSCYRVYTCGPLSGVFANDEWPEEVVAANPAPQED